MAEDGIYLRLKRCKALLVAFQSFGVIPEAEAALIGEDDHSVASCYQRLAGSRSIG